MTSQPSTAAPLRRCGLGLRTPHVAEVMATRPAVSWFEVHAENYMGGGKAVRDLERVRDSYAVSLHGVGLSLGGVERPDAKHLQRLRDLVGRIEPCMVSEHFAWSSFGGVYLNDLLPLPYTRESLDIVARNVTIVQDFLQRPILIENPSAYLALSASTIPEPEFLGLLARRSGCGLLCDVNNVHVTCANTAGNPYDWLDALPAQAVGEIHLAGHAVNHADGRVVLIDDHGSPVAESVWALYGHAVARFPQAPALLEWDNRLPALVTLLEEAAQADARRAAVLGRPCNAAA